MRDLEREVRAAAGRMQPEWTEAHAAEIERRLMGRYRRSKVVKRATLAAAIALVLVGAGLSVLRSPGSRSALPSAADEGVIRLADGSTATPIGAAARLRVIAAEPSLSVIGLEAGAARFTVAKNPTRTFRVRVGGVAVEALGTHFTVERVDDRVGVAVEEGRVRVLWGDRSVELGSGENARFPPIEVAAAPVEPAAPPVEPATPPLRRPDPPAQSKAASQRWKALAEEGKYDQAYAALAHVDPRALGDELADLLLLADVNRFSHHPAESVAPLRKIVRLYRSDPRAPLAAFTLGRVLLEELGEPAEAAGAFARAEALAPKGALAEDAVAREVEAWSRAGESARARARAEEYLARYPDGRRLLSVRRFGRLE